MELFLKVSYDSRLSYNRWSRNDIVGVLRIFLPKNDELNYFNQLAVLNNRLS